MTETALDDDVPMPIVGQQYKAWALWNRCQGVFTDAVYHRKSEADAAMAGCDAYERVVPVIITVEPRERWGMREALEREKETPGIR